LVNTGEERGSQRKRAQKYTLIPFPIFFLHPEIETLRRFLEREHPCLAQGKKNRKFPSPVWSVCNNQSRMLSFMVVSMFPQ
jgi:hypothetical protein